jgi:hypothetical protein
MTFDIVATAGLVLALISLAWQVWSFVDERKGRVGARTRVGSRREFEGGCLTVELWNSGRVPVFVKSVGVTSGGAVGSGDGMIRIQFFAYPEATTALQPGEGRDFVLLGSNVPRQMLEIFVESESLRIDVLTPSGEIFRLAGPAIRRDLSKLKSMLPEDPSDEQPTLVADEIAMVG